MTSTAFFDAKLGFKALNQEASRLERLQQKISSEGWPKDDQDAWIALTAMAASIEKCYSGAEKIVKNLLQELDGAIPSSDDWHRQLIERAANAGPHGRPPIFPEHLANVFHDLRAFRHRERNSYVANLDQAIVLEKAEVTAKAIRTFGECIAQQCAPEEIAKPDDIPRG